MNSDAPEKLLKGPYTAPKLKVGAKAYCHFRRCWMAMASLSNARLPWPQGSPVDVPAAPEEIIVCNELVRAIDSESPAALAYWWGVSEELVESWRTKFGVEDATASGAKKRRRVPEWSEEQLRKLGTKSDAELAKELGRSVGAVQAQRKKRGILPAPPSNAELIEQRARLLWIDDSGALRVVGSVLPLERIVEQYERGIRPEEMVGAKEAALLADVHQVIACYLRHRQEVRDYLKRRRDEAHALRLKIERARLLG